MLRHEALHTEHASLYTIQGNSHSSNTGALILDIFNYQPCEPLVSFSLLVISLLLLPTYN